MVRLLSIVFVALVAGCPPAPDNAKYPAQPDGCAVKTFPEEPPMSTDNIGPVSATCDMSVSNEDCLRTLMDQACELGGDVVWGIGDEPSTKNAKKQWSGRAAHTRGKS